MDKVKHLNFNDLAPDLELESGEGTRTRLSRIWAARPLLLAFTRHFGCTQCKEMLDEIIANQGQIGEAGLAIAIVTMGTREETSAFCREFAPGQLCLADPERKAYQAYGLERGDLFQTVLNPKVWDAISKAKKKGYHIEPPPKGQDAFQMSGTFIISTNGRILLPYYYDNIADHPAMDLLIHGVLSTQWNRPFDGPIGPANNG